MDVIISEWKVEREGYQLYLPDHEIKDCLGCWNCWVKTPGRCIQSDLDALYHAFFHAQSVYFYIDPVFDFISGKLKTVLDRLIVCALPYISYATGESRHMPRYEHIPDFVIYYNDTFTTPEAKAAFHAYFEKVANQFSTSVHIEQVEDCL